MSLAKLVACGLVAFVPALAHAELDCIVPTREEGFDARQPGAAALQRAARAVAAIVQKNSVFTAGNEPVRVRTSISYYGESIQSASVITTAYNQKAWTAGCTLSQFADRGGGLSDGGIAIYINDAGAHLAGRLGDAELVAHVAPEQKGQFANQPVFGAKGDDRDPRVLISAGGYRPWVPVTVADMLAWRERELARDEAEWQKANRGAASGGLDEAKIEEMYQNLQKINPAEAEKMRAQMLASLPKMRADAERAQSAGNESLAKRRASFDAYRASLTPAQLAAQGYSSGATTADGVTLRVDDARGTPLARVDPAYASRDPNRIRLVTVSLAPQPKTDEDYEWHQASLQGVDIAALAALVD